jgi:DNA-binding transcriptional MerR regulator
MAIQQLDLFAGFDAPPPTQTPPENLPAPEEVAVPTITPETPVVTKEADELPVTPGITGEKFDTAARATITDQPVIFQDEKIAVKIKPKVAVQLPRPQQRPSNAAIPASVAVRPKSKRGRKSYKEIDAELDLIEVPDEEVLNQKMYYSITEVAKWFKVNASLLRYWENEFDILKPRKNRKGDRLFRPEDIKNLQVIYYLLRNRKFSLEGAKKYLRNNRQQADVNVQLAQSLTKFRSFLLELKANLGA